MTESRARIAPVLTQWGVLPFPGRASACSGLCCSPWSCSRSTALNPEAVLHLPEVKRVHHLIAFFTCGFELVFLWANSEETKKGGTEKDRFHALTSGVFFLRQCDDRSQLSGVSAGNPCVVFIMYFFIPTWMCGFHGPPSHETCSTCNEPCKYAAYA